MDTQPEFKLDENSVAKVRPIAVHHDRERKIEELPMKEMLESLFRGRPIWMNVIMVFCLYMTFVYMPFDFFLKPMDQDKEVWFGFVLTGWAAKATEPIHWAIYAAGSWGFYRMRSWMWPWASLYVVQIAIGMFVWTTMSDNFGGALAGILASVPFIALAVALWRAKPRFQGQPGTGQDDANIEASMSETDTDSETG